MSAEDEGQPELSALAAFRARTPSSTGSPAAQLEPQLEPSRLEPPQLEPPRPILLILVGLPGSGKSTFAHALESLGWVRASQDDSASHTRREVEDLVFDALQMGNNVVVDRVNFDASQRAHFIALGGAAHVWGLVFDLPIHVLRARLDVREDHPTLPREKALGVLNAMMRSMRFPTFQEGFERILVVNEWEDAGRLLERVWSEGSEARGGWRGRGRGPGRGRGRGRGGGGAHGHPGPRYSGRGYRGGPRGRGAPRGDRAPAPPQGSQINGPQRSQPNGSQRSQPSGSQLQFTPHAVQLPRERDSRAA